MKQVPLRRISDSADISHLSKETQEVLKPLKNSITKVSESAGDYDVHLKETALFSSIFKRLLGDKKWQGMVIRNGKIVLTFYK